MDPQILIDAIVRQTMVLIARLSTVDGVRSPLAHVANEVFVGLVREAAETLLYRLTSGQQPLQAFI